MIDFDNVTLGVRSDLTKELRTLLNSDIIKGKVAVQRAYADWRRYPQYIVSLSESSIDLIFAPAFGSQKKNATDIRLAVDAVELVFTRPEIGTFILLSGDSDFSSLVIKLKEYGKYVIGVGIRESASDILVQNCDEYYSYSDLAGLTKESDAPGIKRDPWELVREAVGQMARNRDVMRSDRLKQVMQQLDPSFDERDAGFNRFSKFVTEAGSRGLLKVTKLENGQFEIGPATETAAAAPARSAPAVEERPAREERGPREERSGRGRRGRGRGRGRGDRADAPAAESTGAPRAPERTSGSGGLTLARAFQLMHRALAEFRAPVGAERLRLRMIAVNGREDALLASDRFEKLLRQAHDAEVADVRSLPDGGFDVAGHAVGSAIMRAEEAGGVVELQPPSLAGNGGPTAGLRMRKGSKGPRVDQVPMVGMVSLDDDEPAGTPASSAEDGQAAESIGSDGDEPVEAGIAGDEPKAAKKRSRGSRGGRGKGAKAAKAAATESPASEAAEKPKRAPRRAAKKKAAE